MPLDRARAADRWTLDAALKPGANTIYFRATDRYGNVSETARHVTMVKFGPVTVSVNPPEAGRVTTGFLGTTAHQLGVPTIIMATAKAGFAFDHWVGIESNSAVLQFLPFENQTLVAEFIPSPFLALTGTYFGGLASGDPQRSGLVTFTLTGTGTFTARATIGGVDFTGKGTLQTDGSTSATLTRPGSSRPLVVQLDFTGAEQISGTLGGASFTANRDTFNSTHASGLRGNYTISLAPDADPATPQGTGFAVAKINDLGRVRVVGTLADGTPFSQSSRVSKTKTWPLSVPLHARLGLLAGEVAIDDTTARGMSTELLWIKPPRPADRGFPSGFIAHPMLAGSSYNGDLTPNLLGLPDVIENAQLTLDTGAPIAATLAKTNAVSFAGTRPPVLTIKSGSGLVRGSFFAPGASTRTSFSGVILQSASSAAGFYFDPVQSRPFVFEAKP